MKDYLRRATKFFIYVVVILLLAFVIVPLIRGEAIAAGWERIVNDRTNLLIILFFAAYSLIYPLLGYGKIKRHLNGNYADNSEHFEKAFEAMGYIKTATRDDRIVYRRKSGLSRFMEMYEDGIEVFTGEDPVIISGLRKRITRINRIIDDLMLKNAV